jgi:hypothetical protein
VKRKREIATGLLIMAIATVFAQTTPPTDQKTPPDKKPAEGAVKPPEIAKLNLELGWSSWDLRGNSHRFRQYATPPHGLFLRDLSYAPATLDGRHDGEIHIQTPWNDDYRLGGTMRLNHGTTQVSVSDSRNRFFDPTPIVIDPSERHISEASLRQNVGPNLALSVHSRMDQQDLVFEPPADAVHQRTRVWNAAAEGTPWHGGFADLSYTDFRYWDRTNLQPDMNMQLWSAGLTHQFGDSFNLSGSYARSLIHQTSLATSKVDSWSFGGGLELLSDTSFQFDVRQEKLTLPTILTAYDSSRSQARGRLIQHFKNWTAQFGYSRLAVDRVNADHTFVNVPKIHTFDAQFSGRLTPSLRFTAKASRETMQGSAQMQTDDPRALYWRNRTSAQIKLDGTSDNATGYFVFGLHEDKNEARDVRVRNQTLTLGGTLQAQSQLEIFFETSTDMWGGRMADPQAEPFNAYFPDATTFLLGANWTINDFSYASASYTQVLADNANPLGLPDGNIRTSLLTASFNYKAPMGLEFGITFAPWHYTDRLTAARGYSTGLISITAKAKF